jgi:hypothetical protein
MPSASIRQLVSDHNFEEQAFYEVNSLVRKNVRFVARWTAFSDIISNHRVQNDQEAAQFPENSNSTWCETQMCESMGLTWMINMTYITTIAAESISFRDLSAPKLSPTEWALLKSGRTNRNAYELSKQIPPIWMVELTRLSLNLWKCSCQLWKTHKERKFDSAGKRGQNLHFERAGCHRSCSHLQRFIRVSKIHEVDWTRSNRRNRHLGAVDEKTLRKTGQISPVKKINKTKQIGQGVGSSDRRSRWRFHLYQSFARVVSLYSIHTNFLGKRSGISSMHYI